MTTKIPKTPNLKFNNLRSTASRKKWPRFFVTSRTRSAPVKRFLSLFVETPDGVMLEAHGEIEPAAIDMTNQCVAAGLMQTGPGAPKGNDHAKAENRKVGEPPKNDLRKK